MVGTITPEPLVLSHASVCNYTTTQSHSALKPRPLNLTGFLCRPPSVNTLAHYSLTLHLRGLTGAVKEYNPFPTPGGLTGPDPRTEVMLQLPQLYTPSQTTFCFSSGCTWLCSDAHPNTT